LQGGAGTIASISRVFPAREHCNLLAVGRNLGEGVRAGQVTPAAFVWACVERRDGRQCVVVDQEEACLGEVDQVG
jgi:hypothetical protein